MAGDIYTGTLDLLILHSLRQGPKHGYLICQWIRERSSGVLDVGEAALYAALRRQERDGRIRGEWGLTDHGRRARIYSLTDNGWKDLTREATRWNLHVKAVYAVLGPEER